MPNKLYFKNNLTFLHIPSDKGKKFLYPDYRMVAGDFLETVMGVV